MTTPLYDTTTYPEPQHVFPALVLGSCRLAHVTFASQRFRMCIHSLCIFHCGHHQFSSTPLIPCAQREQDCRLPTDFHHLNNLMPYPTARALNQRLTQRSRSQSPVTKKDVTSVDPIRSNIHPVETGCRSRGHPYRSHFVPYICARCEYDYRKAEEDRCARFAAGLAEDGLVEHVRLQEWQWRVKLGVKPLSQKQHHVRDRGSNSSNRTTSSGTYVNSVRNSSAPAARKSVVDGDGDGDILPPQEKEELQILRRVEEREMLRRMEEANKELEAGQKRTSRELMGKRRSWMGSWRVSWGGSGGVVGL